MRKDSTRREFLLRDLPALVALAKGTEAYAQQNIVPESTTPIENPTQLEIVRKAAFETERQFLIEDFKQKTLEFDALKLAKKFLDFLGAPPTYFKAFKESSKGIPMQKGFTSLKQLPMKAVEILISVFHDKTIQNHLKQTNISGEATTLTNQGYEEWGQDFVHKILVDFLDVPLDRMREHVTKYSEQDLAIFYGPVTNAMEFVGELLHEPFALYLQMVYGRKAKEFFSVKYPESLEELKKIFLDPAFQHVALISHGSWDSFSMEGYHVHPEKTLGQTIQAFKKDPERMTAILTRMDLDALLEGQSQGHDFTEDDLKALIASQALTPADLAKIQKQSVTRYTCGYGRYEIPSSVAIPDLFGPSYLLDKKAAVTSVPVSGLLEAAKTHDMARMAELMMQVDKNKSLSRVSASRPDLVGQYEQQLADLVKSKRSQIRVIPGLGESIVHNPAYARGFEGEAWIDDFIKNPLPKNKPYPF